VTNLQSPSPKDSRHPSDYPVVSLESVLTRIQALDNAFAPPQSAPAVSSSSSGTSFASALQGAMGTTATAATAPVSGSSVGARIVAAAAGEVGQAEQPPGSNNSPRIAQYRAATAGNPGPGPWCAYFVSWAARQAGAPLGDQGQGFGSVDALYAWAQQTGRAYTASSGRTPQPGDLIVFHEHIGIVESVDANGQIHTIEGNSSDQVARRVHPMSDAVGFVHVG
jgi:hypothetical protein